MALVTLVAALLLPALIVAEDFYTGTDVVELTASNFKSKVLDDDHVWMIEFYAPWCGHCQRLKPDYIKAATASKGIVRFGAINCDDHRSIASEYGVKGFPTLKLFGPNKKRPDDYNGARSAKAMADAAIALIPNHVTIVTSSSHADFLEKNAGMPKAVLFTAKSSTTALYKALAVDLKGRMTLAEIRAKKEASLLEKYGVEESQLPVLLVLPGSAEEAASTTYPRYEGELRHKPLLQFLSQYAKPKAEAAGKSTTTTSSKKKEEPKGSVEQLLTPADVDSKCLKGKGFCVIALLPGEGSEKHTDHLQALDTLLLKYHKDPLRFLWVDTTKTPAIKSHFVKADEGETQPAVVLLSPKKGKYALHWGFDGLDSLLDRAIGGDVTFESVVEDSWHESLASA